MSAVRMVAYGVLEMKHKGPRRYSNWLDKPDEESEQEKKDDFERDQLRKLVNDELKRYGMLIQREVKPTPRGGWRTRDNHHILYGQLVGINSFLGRTVLAEGTFKECCVKAAEVLDALGVAQGEVPE